MNHSAEFVNGDSDYRNKIEGHWRQAKCKLPKFGVRKHLFSTYLVEFMWRYMHRKEDLFAIFLNNVKKMYVTSSEPLTRFSIYNNIRCTDWQK